MAAKVCWPRVSTRATLGQVQLGSLHAPLKRRRQGLPPPGMQRLLMWRVAHYLPGRLAEVGRMRRDAPSDHWEDVVVSQQGRPDFLEWR